MRTAVAATGLCVITTLLGAAACGADNPSADELQQRASAECEPFQDGTFPMMAALAITMAFEMQRWEATTDLEFVANRLQLTQTALDRCVDFGIPGCDNTTAILDFQDASPLIVDGEVLFNPELYRELLKQYFQRQMVMDNLPCSHPDASWCAEHALTFDHTEEGPCALDYFYAIDATIPERCSAWGHDGCTGGRALRCRHRDHGHQGRCRGGHANRCRDIDLDPTRIVTKLTFAGYPENGYLDPDFQFVDGVTLVGIDPPLFSMIAGESVPMVDGCYEAIAVYDPDGTREGACCRVHETTGTLVVSSWNDATLVCE